MNLRLGSRFAAHLPLTARIIAALSSSVALLLLSMSAFAPGTADAALSTAPSAPSPPPPPTSTDPASRSRASDVPDVRRTTIATTTTTTTTTTATTATTATHTPRPVPPGRLVIGYSHDPSGSRVRSAIESGVNVVIWSFVHFDVDAESHQPTIRTDLDLDAIRSIREREGWGGVLHVAAVGGWNGPHPPPVVSAEGWARAFVTFNSDAGHIFDGLDWDLEGHDDRDGPTSRFTIETLDVMADVSVILKRTHGMSVSMAPAESYLDPLSEDAAFDLGLNLFPRPWDRAPEDSELVRRGGFEHAGRQCYAYVLRRAGTETFDWVSVQLYESYSRYLHETTAGAGGAAADEVTAQIDGITRRTVAFFDGFDVDLPDPYGRTTISVMPNRLVFGFANGWADGKKVVRVERRTISEIFLRLKIRGVMFWTIEEEGAGGFYMAEAISEAIRESEEYEEKKHMDVEEDDDDDDDDDGDGGFDGSAPDRDEL